jgi:Leucine-rich repeat (LRR) protein
MDQQEHKNEFFNLINVVYFNLFKYLSLPDLLKMRLTSKKIKEVVDTYIKRHRQTLLHLPSSMYRQHNLPENIVKACAYFGKQPEECDMTLNCKIFYDVRNTRVTTTPPMKALSAVGESGVKISLNIMFDFRYDDPSINLWSSYISTLEEIVQFLPHTESLHLDFSSEIMEDWGNDVINSLSQMTQLTSLSICKMHVDGTELITCLSKMTRLSSFSISEIFIEGLYSNELGDALQMVVPRLSKLKLSNSSVDFESIIEVLPHIKSLLSNLTSLDLSNNGIDRNKLYKIVYDISGHCSNLRTLNLSDNQICMHKQGVLPLPPIIPFIQSLNNLERLSLAGNGLNGICIVELNPSLQMLPLLSNLDLSSNNLDYDAIKFVTEYFRRLKVLNVTDNKPSDEQTGRMERME